MFSLPRRPAFRHNAAKIQTTAIFIFRLTRVDTRNPCRRRNRSQILDWGIKYLRYEFYPTRSSTHASKAMGGRKCDSCTGHPQAVCTWRFLRSSLHMSLLYIHLFSPDCSTVRRSFSSVYAQFEITVPAAWRPRVPAIALDATLIVASCLAFRTGSSVIPA